MSRYIFVQSTTKDELLRLRDGLYEYIKTYRNIGKRTALVTFFKPPKEVVYAEYYKGQFWKVLQFLTSFRKKSPTSKRSESGR
ncbi:MULTISPECIES: YqcI/YcgG family protein [Geobacillus]|uniref:YqcI/YcgG family protein n=1 Tax=Geobacillus TaxID=129337 RepID=UPI001F52B3B2|nr:MULTISPECIES: YqcI/YcgG family protein [Geobacillus]